MSDKLDIKASQIRCLILDLDGVLTDGFIYLDEKGQQSRRYHVHDGMGIKLLLNAGFEVALITGTAHKVISSRIKQLGIQHAYCSCVDKTPAFNSLLDKLGLAASEVAYIGDDIQDLAILKEVGLSIAVPNAVIEIKPYVDYVTQAPGGQGAVREIANWLLQVSNQTDSALAQYLSHA